MERWAAVLGYEGFYEVSDAGRLRRVSKRRKQTKSGEYLKAPSRQPRGYLQYVLCVDGKVRSKLAHRLVWEAFNGAIPEGIEINHLNGLKDDNRLSNLELCSHSENLVHAYRVLKRGLKDQQGEKNENSKLTLSTVREIRKLLSDGLSGVAISKQFDISQATVSLIKSGKRWPDTSYASGVAAT